MISPTSARLHPGMNRTFKVGVAALMLAVSFAGSVGAGPFEDAAAAYKAGDYATALRLMRPLAERGNAPAQQVLGAIYYKGEGVPKDFAAAASWYCKAAEQGIADAQAQLGFMYGLGLGVPEDQAAAAVWIRKAADQGDARAQTYLGGMSFPRDYAAAASWWRKAADQGNADAQLSLGQMYRDGQGVPQTMSPRTCGSIWLQRAGTKTR
jgi:uncharacterized protein